jgi:hypothetical protein
MKHECLTNPSSSRIVWAFWFATPYSYDTEPDVSEEHTDYMAQEEAKLVLHFDQEDGGDIPLQNVALSPN